MMMYVCVVREREGNTLAIIAYFRPPPSRARFANQPNSPTMTTTKYTIFIEGIPYDTTKDEMTKTISSVCGEGVAVVDLRFPTWQDSGRSRGYAHCDFSNEAEMERAMKRLDHHEMSTRDDGKNKKTTRYLSVSRAKTNEKTGDGGEIGETDEEPLLPSPESDADESKNSASLFLKNLPYDITESELRSNFVKYGKIASTRLARWNHTQKLKGFGYVTFASKQDTVNAIRSMRKHGVMEIRGRKLRIDYDRGAPKRGFKDAQGRDWHKTKEAKVSELGKITAATATASGVKAASAMTTSTTTTKSRDKRSEAEEEEANAGDEEEDKKNKKKKRRMSVEEE